MVLSVASLPLWWLAAPLTFGLFISAKGRGQPPMPVNHTTFVLAIVEWAFFPATAASRLFAGSGDGRCDGE